MEYDPYDQPIETKTKNELRKIYLTKRLALTPSQHQILSKQIADNFVLHFPPHTIRALHTYIPLTSKREPNTNLITDAIIKHNSHIPIINPTKTEPNNHASIITHLSHRFRPSHIIVPLLAVDPNGHRIGFGAGYYDIFLSHFPKSTVKIGLSFFEPHPKAFQSEPHDIKLNYIVTPNEVYKVTE